MDKKYKWKEIAQKSDHVINSGVPKDIERQYNILMKLASSEEETVLNKSRYYYYAYNCFSRIHNGDDIKNQKVDLFLIRKALYLFNEFKQSDEYNEKDENIIYYYVRLKVSLGNILDQCGRIIPAISNYLDVNEFNSIEVIFNLALSLFYYARKISNTDQKHYLFRYSLKLFEDVIGADPKALEVTGYKDAISKYETIIDSLKNKKEHLQKASIPTKINELNDREMSETEHSYRIWIGNNSLALNYLNDVNKSIDYAFDSECSYTE